MNLPLKHIWQPATSTSQRLVIVLHGRGDSAEGFLWLQEELGIDELNFLLLDAPDKYYTGYSWYDLPPDQLPGIQRSRELLAGVLEQTEREGYSPNQTFLFGFSQGCFASCANTPILSRRGQSLSERPGSAKQNPPQAPPVRDPAARSRMSCCQRLRLTLCVTMQRDG